MCYAYCDWLNVGHFTLLIELCALKNKKNPRGQPGPLCGSSLPLSPVEPVRVVRPI